MNELELRQEAEQRISIDIDISSINHINEADKLLAAYTNGWISPLDAIVKLEHIKKIVDIAVEKVKDDSVDYISRTYGKKTVNISGLEITYKSGRILHSYENNPIILDLENKIKEKKDIAKKLNKIPVADTETGELIYPSIKNYTKDTLQIKFK